MGGKGVCLLIWDHMQIKAFGEGRSLGFFVLFTSVRRRGRKCRDENCIAAVLKECLLLALFKNILVIPVC